MENFFATREVTESILMDRYASLSPGEPVPPSPPTDLQRVFIGKEGLRAGWGLLIFIVLFVVSIACRSVILHALHPAGAELKPASEIPAAPWMLLAYAATCLMLLLITWFMSKIERRPNSVYGLGGNGKVRRFLAGLVWGMACLSLLILILFKCGFLIFEGRALFGAGILRYGAYWFLNFLMVGLFEEYSSRGYVLYTLARGFTVLYRRAFPPRNSATLGFWSAAVVISLLFGLVHSGNTGESPLGLLAASLVSMVFCLSLWRTGSLWWAMGFHGAWDWSQSFLYGVADSGMMAQHRLLVTHPVGNSLLSGGTTGPEGSVFVLPILALICIIIMLTLRPKPLAPAPEDSPRS